MWQFQNPMSARAFVYNTLERFMLTIDDKIRTKKNHLVERREKGRLGEHQIGWMKNNLTSVFRHRMEWQTIDIVFIRGFNECANHLFYHSTVRLRRIGFYLKSPTANTILPWWPKQNKWLNPIVIRNYSDLYLALSPLVQCFLVLLSQCVGAAAAGCIHVFRPWFMVQVLCQIFMYILFQFMRKGFDESCIPFAFYLIVLCRAEHTMQSPVLKING